MAEVASHTEIGQHGVNTKKVQFEIPIFAAFSEFQTLFNAPLNQ